jgi:uncharacterized Zn finger protein
MWTVYYEGTHYPCADVNITLQLESLNYAIVKINNGNIPNDTTIALYKDGSEYMTGYTKRSIDPMDDTTKYMVTEKAVELRDYLCDDGSGTYDFAFENSTVLAVMTSILDGTGWSFSDRGSGYDSYSVPNMALFYANVVDATFKLLRIYCNAKVWFDSDSKTVYCDDSRVDHGSITYSLKTPDKTSAGRNITKVIVLGQGEAIRGVAGSGTKVQVYRYNDCTTVSEATKVAETILDEINSESVRIEVEMPPSISYREGDLVTVDGVEYQVFDVKISYDKTVLGVGSSEISIFDQFQGAIQKVSGVVTIDDSNFAKLDSSNVFTGGTNEFPLIQTVQLGGVSGNDLTIKGPEDQVINFQPGGMESPVLIMYPNGTLALGVYGGSGAIMLDGGDISTSEMMIRKTSSSVMDLKVPANGVVRITVG